MHPDRGFGVFVIAFAGDVLVRVSLAAERIRCLRGVRRSIR